MTNREASRILDCMDRFLGTRYNDYSERDHDAFLLAIKALEERPHGKWKTFDLTFGRNFYYCTVCKETESLPPTRWFKFCPNCGADMRGGQEDDPN